MSDLETFDVVVVGGGPSGATAAKDLASKGHKVMLLDRAGRIKPCGGAIPPRLIKDFEIPDHLLVAKITCARMISPKDEKVDIHIQGGFVGMVDREVFDEFLRDRAAQAGAVRRTGTFEQLSRDHDGTALIEYSRPGDDGNRATIHVRARCVIGADGAASSVARQAVPGAERVPYVFAYHEIVRAPETGVGDYDATRCDVYYRGKLSPDFYGWVFPHGQTASVGTGSARKGFSLRNATGELRDVAGLGTAEIIRREGAPIPMKPLKRWDNGRDVILAGDAAGVVAPASGEGIYYAMYCGRLVADATSAFLATGDAKALKQARKTFMKVHGTVFWVLGIMQYYWYGTEKRRESFVAMCKDPDVQRLTFEAYMNKELVKRDPFAHIKIFLKDLGHLTGLIRA
jgi:geranylgeranyl reductase